MSASASPQTGSRDAAVVVAAVAWLLAFSAHFFAQPLANDPEFRRTAVLAQSHWLVLDNVLPAADDQAQNSGWRYFPQRIDLLFVAGTMLLAIWSAGRHCMRWFGLPPATRVEQTVFAFGLGFSICTIATLSLGLGGMLTRPVVVVLMLALFANEALVHIRRRREASSMGEAAKSELLDRRFLGGPKFPAAVCLAAAPFVLAMLLGSMLPTTDFDVKEYHLQGPKEWYQQGRITFLPHNVYTSFPFLTEMVSLWGMVLRGDWYRGALVGQVVLMAFAPLSALVIYAICRKVSTTAGWLGVGVFLTIPWIYRISVIAYAEGGLTFYLAATFLAWRNWKTDAAWPNSWRGVLLCGLLAGSALACKYPGLVSVTVPMGLAVVVAAIRRKGAPLLERPTSDVESEIGTASAGQAVPVHDSSTTLPARSSGAPPRGFDVRGAAMAAAVFSLGAAITFGPWALKNLIQTGNPVYPLGYTVFGGRDWTPELNEKWRNGHKPQVRWRQPAGIPADLLRQAQEVAVRTTWQSPLVFGLAPLALLALRRRKPGEGEAPAEPRRLVISLLVYAVWLFLTWWGLTHRIDRFWLPMLPIACALAGIGGAEVFGRIERIRNTVRTGVATASAVALTGLLVVATAYNLACVTTTISGNNGYLMDEAAARRVAQRKTPGIALLESRLPEGARVLLVGEAAVFDASFDLRYNTVFDFELLQAWATDDPLSLSEPDIPLKSRDEILAAFGEQGITHVLVNWLEILRYREPGSYTYTEFVSPRTMRKLVELGVLASVPLSPQEGLVEFEGLSANKQKVVESWAPELKTSVVQGGRAIPAVTAYELYNVADAGFAQ